MCARLRYPGLYNNLAGMNRCAPYQGAVCASLEASFASYIPHRGHSAHPWETLKRSAGLSDVTSRAETLVSITSAHPPLLSQTVFGDKTIHWALIQGLAKVRSQRQYELQSSLAWLNMG